jgi:hypothetical protein
MSTHFCHVQGMHVPRVRTLKKVVWRRGNVNSMVIEFAYRFGHYCRTSSGYYATCRHSTLASHWSNVNSKTADIHGSYAQYK